MLNWLRKPISTSAAVDSHSANASDADPPGSTQADYNPLRIDQLFVEPDATDDFDRKACERFGMWPYSDTIWLYSSFDRDGIASMVAPIEPDDVRDASVDDPNWDLTPPVAPTDGVRPYWVWWD